MKKFLILIFNSYVILYCIFFIDEYFLWSGPEFKREYTIKNNSIQEIIIYEQGKERGFDKITKLEVPLNPIFIRPHKEIKLCENKTNTCFENFRIIKGEKVIFESNHTDWSSISLEGEYNTPYINVKTIVDIKEFTMYLPFYIYVEKMTFKTNLVVK